MADVDHIIHSWYIHRNDEEATHILNVEASGFLTEGQLDSLMNSMVEWAEANDMHLYSFPLPKNPQHVPVKAAEDEVSYDYRQGKY